MAQARDPRHPEDGEFDEYYRMYIEKVPPGDVVEFLATQGETLTSLLRSVPPEREEFRYAPAKWSLKEVVGHVVDTEWIFTYRALRFARNDTTPLVGLDQDPMVAGGNFGERSLADMTLEFEHVRAANQQLFRSFDESIMARRGTASDCPFTVRSMLFVIAGHVQHHLEVLRERYL